MTDFTRIKNLINPQKNADKDYFLSLIDVQKQKEYENEHINAVLVMLRAVYISKLKRKIAVAEEEIKKLRAESDYGAKEYREILNLRSNIEVAR